MTKIIKKGIPTNFITGDDVIITKGINHPGKTVDEAIEDVDNKLQKHENDIEKLKSNLKYIYSYGGVGGNGRGGSGSGEVVNPNLYVSLNGRRIQAGPENIIILNEPGDYTIEGNLSGNGGKTFYVSIGYGNNINRPIEFTLDADTKWKIKPTTLKLNRNGEIVIKLSDSEGPISEISQQYIVTPHTYKSRFMYEYDNGTGNKQYNEFSPYEYFIGSYSQSNPFIEFSFKIDLLNVTHIQVKYDISDTDGEDNNISFDSITADNPITCGHGIVNFGSTTNITNNTLKIYLDNLTKNGEKFTSESNNGTYHVSLKFSYSVNGSEPIIPEENFDITLIPNDLYIHVRNPQGIMYDSLDEIKDACDSGDYGVPKKNINLGSYTRFYCKVFEGSMINDAEHYYLEFSVYDYAVDDNVESFVLNQTYTNSDVTEQVETNPPFSVAFQSKGIKKLEFKTNSKKDVGSTSTVKYIFVNEPSHDIEDWYPSSLEQSSFYFRANFGTNINSDLLRDLHPFETSEKDRPVTLPGNWTELDASKATTIISFGLQYSSVNAIGAKILDVYGTSQTPLFTLYSNKLFDATKTICIPSEKKYDKSVNEQYHLIQIVRHKIDDKGSGQYASYLYVDGRLESNKSTVDSNPWRVNRIVFNNVNAVYNLINIQYVKLFTPGIIIGNQDRENIPTIDELIYQYYLAYKDIMGCAGGEVSDAEKTIYDNMSSIKFDGTNVIVDYDFVKNVSTDMPIPTMMMEYVPSETEDPNNIITDLFRGYNTASNDFEPKQILLHWANGSGSALEENPLSIPEFVENGITYTGVWKFKLQGTSTMRNRIKNFSLFIETTSNGLKEILVSPNYNENDSSTFLPEQIWTLKADIADSAHANNTSVGKFVNTVCTKFSSSMNLDFDDDVKPYIKNTLEGFPVLMYFKVNDDVYYLGVYNFNMGRDSYYNLGYHTNSDTTSMKNLIQGSGKDSTPFRYSIGYSTIPDKLAVGEIQDNHAEFDFHQYDESVLYGRSGTMFGPNDKITGTGDEKASAKGTLKQFVRSVARAGAYCFANMDKTPKPSKKDVAFGDDDTSLESVVRYSYDSYLDEENEIRFREYVPDISWQFVIDADGINKWYDPDSPNYPSDRERPIRFEDVHDDIDNLLQCISDTDYENMPKENFHYLDFSSVAEYYTICMAFGLVDSVLKNMNIKSWDGKKCCVAFYDMDCAMGEDNKGEDNVSYLAASDYWYSPNNNGYIEQVQIHYDYWEESIGKGFDYPSSYLFAIAKYAQAFVNKQLGRSLTRYPQQFWAELRLPTSNPLNPAAGELRNADYFVEKYFSSGIGQIPAYLASMNYQVKYLYYGKKIDSDGNESVESTYLANGGAFNGSRLERVRDWLNNRLHFLDFMFNIQAIDVSIGGGYFMPLANSGTLAEVKKNDDVIILSDAFTDPTFNGAYVKSDSQPVDVYAPMNTPFIIKRGSHSQMFLLCAGNNVANSIRINVTKSEPVNFYGSKEFKKLSMVDPFLTNFNAIVSNNIEEIYYGGLPIPPITAGLKIVSTSVKKIRLNISQMSGTLEIPTNDLNGQALSSLDVHESGLIGSWTQLKNLQTLNISSVNNYDGEIYVAECPLSGENCIISGESVNNPTILKTLRMSGITGNFKINNTSIEKIDFTATKDTDATFEISGDKRLNILKLTGFKSVIINDCPNLETLYIEDFNDSTIKCEKIIVDIPDYINPDGTPQTTLKYFNTDSNVNGVFDFTGYENLQVLGLSGSQAVVIKMPNHSVKIETFKNNKLLEFIDTPGRHSKIELTRDSTFYNCPRYGMRQSWWSKGGDPPVGTNGVDIKTLDSASPQVGKYTKICISANCDSLAHTFDKVDSGIKSDYLSDATTPRSYTNSWGQKVYNQGLTLKDAQYFIENFVGGLPVDDAYIEDDIITDSQMTTVSIGSDRRAKIETLQYCFHKQSTIVYEVTNATGSTQPPSLSEYKKLTNISYMYYGTGVKLLSAALLSLPEELNTNDNDTIAWGDFIGSGELNITNDAFKNISYRITGFMTMALTIRDASYPRTIINLEDNGEYYDIVDLLCPQQYVDEGSSEEVETFIRNENGTDVVYKAFTRITTFNTFYINQSQYVDYRLLFKACPNVTSLSSFLSCDLSKAKIDGMLKTCKKLTYIYDSFNHNGDVNSLTAIDLYDFFNWGDVNHRDESLFTITNLFASSSNEMVGFSVKKTISNAHFKEILGLLHNYKSTKRLSNLFSYCTIIGYDGSPIKLEADMLDIDNINSLFYECKGVDTLGNNVPLNIRRSFFEHLPNVKLMANTFGGVHFDHMLSYDFFCKRMAITEPVFVKENGNIPNTPNATLFTTGYSNNYQINTMFNCFKNAKFENCRCWFDVENDFDEEDQHMPIQDVVLLDNTGAECDTYYRKLSGTPIEYKIKKPYAYSDTLNNYTHYTKKVTCAANSNVDINNHNLNTELGDMSSDLNTYRNLQDGLPYLENEYNIYPTYCCLPPDIFYACNYECNLTGVFSNTNIIGVIPQHLLQNCAYGKLENMFENVNILPNLMYHYDNRYLYYLDEDPREDPDGWESKHQKHLDYVAFISRKDENDNYLIPIDNESITVYSSDIDKVVYHLEGSTDDDALVLFRNSDGELVRRYPIVSVSDKDTGDPINDITYLDYNKSQFTYVPQGYTTNEYLKKAFTFRYNLPPNVNLKKGYLLEERITWPTSDNDIYNNTYSPELRPDLWPYHIQYFFTVDESVSWKRIRDMSYPFISDGQDVSFEKNLDGTYEKREFSSIDPSNNNRWWNEQTVVEKGYWDQQTEGIFNVFLNLCGQRDVRTGKMTDSGCILSKAFNNYPPLDSFISGNLFTFLNGKVFDDNTDGGRFTDSNGSSSRIMVNSNGFARNIVLPKFIYMSSSNPTLCSKVLLQHDQQRSLYYRFMFIDTTSLDHYMSVLMINDNNYKSGVRYKLVQ